MCFRVFVQLAQCGDLIVVCVDFLEIFGSDPTGLLVAAGLFVVIGQVSSYFFAEVETWGQVLNRKLIANDTSHTSGGRQANR